MCGVRIIVLYQFREGTYWTNFSFEISHWKHEKRCDAFLEKEERLSFGMAKFLLLKIF